MNLKDILIRLLKLPIYILFFLTICTVIIPLLYWVLTGEDYALLMNKI